MKRLTHWQNLSAQDRGASVAMGNFDGVHRGHCSLLDLAKAEGGPTGVVTFEPHPRQYFSAGGESFRLMDAETRAGVLAAEGIELVYELPFTELAALSAEDFVREVLVEGLGVRHVVVGDDFTFGSKRSGSTELLKTLGARYGFGVTVARKLCDVDGVISSTAIRAALTAGDPRKAARLLGHWHRFEGPVIHGEKRGRELGFPTANMAVEGLHLPKLGVYAVRVEVLEGPHKGLYSGAASLGVRPMFGENTPNLETYLMDFKGDLYGTRLSVSLVDYLRGEVKFTTLPALIEQMARDCEDARRSLAVA
ncbi:bifunctional riboflavin kinase/FAD synthetase [Falsigemmobacter faecalis]|uniref:Riboflavin biosynthesis protein n=1 Tax=Falsigemmobacter faecalis TaxID=2488730 RepID=A0A3P3DQY6_9RHOB|nr:bifunctional riboflavin kinase/FAD synthetase [Falsigemmobacter faecalis]RRH76677.1 bifunctional riboflavin kinase/FAD synthetase [Falsigemmobacter faecalis]